MELNGNPASTEDVSPLALYNYGNFTTILVDDGRVRGLKSHLSRLEADSRLLFGTSVPEERIMEYVRHAVQGQPGKTVVRVTIFSKMFSLLKPGPGNGLDVLITTRSAPDGPLPAVSLKPITFQRDLPEAKTASIGGTLYRRRLAQADGFDDALFVNADGEVSEGPTWNIGFVKDGRIILPDAPSLPGVSIQLLATALKHEGKPVRTQTVRLADVAGMDAAFVGSATNGFRLVARIGDRVFKKSGFIDDIRRAYESTPFESL